MCTGTARPGRRRASRLGAAQLNWAKVARDAPTTLHLPHLILRAAFYNGSHAPGGQRPPSFSLHVCV